LSSSNPERFFLYSITLQYRFEIEQDRTGVLVESQYDMPLSNMDSNCFEKNLYKSDDVHIFRLYRNDFIISEVYLITEFDSIRFKALFQRYIEEDKFSGTVLVVKDNEVIFEKAYGVACKSFNVKNRIDTKFNIGSLNKLFTKIAILQLAQRGLLGIDDLVGKHLPNFREDIASKGTIRHLISFTSGLGDYFNEKFFASLGNLRKVDDFLPFFIDAPLLCEPGEERNYSNAGYVVLGKIIEAVSGQDYYDYIRENIYIPAGMENSDHYEIDSVVENRAIGYTRYMLDGIFHPTRRRRNFFLIGSRGSPAGGGYSTVYDMLNFDRALHQEILLDSNYLKMALMPLNANLNSKPRCMILAGGAQGLTALYMKFFETGYTVFVMSNYDPDDVEPLVDEIRSLLMPDNEEKSIVKLRNKK
jgi:D-alanyl-D-alanine carboxypeptidase